MTPTLNNKPGHRAPSRSSIRRNLVFGLGLVALLDQLSKAAAQALLIFNVPVVLIPNVFQLRLTYNTGAAFSLFHQSPWLLSWVACFIFIALLLYGFYKNHWFPKERWGFVFLLGGALGNLIDRFRLGQVTDFLEITFIQYPVFNLADSFICLGTAWLAWLYLRGNQSSETKA